jgi:hypothetical protein
MFKKKTLLFILFVFFILFFQKTNSKEIKNNIIVSVNNLIITELDLTKEIKFIQFINKYNNSTEPEIETLRRQSINNLINKKIKDIETDFYKIFISEKEIENNLYIQLSNLKINKEDLDKFYEKNEIEKNYLKDSVKIDLEWSELINQLYQNRLNINLTEINTEIENIDKGEKIDENKRILKEKIILAEKNKFAIFTRPNLRGVFLISPTNSNKPRKLLCVLFAHPQKPTKANPSPTSG